MRTMLEITDDIPLDAPDREELLAEQKREHKKNRAFIKLPGELDRCIQVYDPSDIQNAYSDDCLYLYLIDSQVINWEATNEVQKVDPDTYVFYPEGEFGYIVDPDGSHNTLAYKNTGTLIAYLRKLYTQGYKTVEDFDNIEGIELWSIEDSSFNPYPDMAPTKEQIEKERLSNLSRPKAATANKFMFGMRGKGIASSTISSSRGGSGRRQDKNIEEEEEPNEELTQEEYERYLRDFEEDRQRAEEKSKNGGPKKKASSISNRGRNTGNNDRARNAGGSARGGGILGGRGAGMLGGRGRGGVR